MKKRTRTINIGDRVLYEDSDGVYEFTVCEIKMKKGEPWVWGYDLPEHERYYRYGNNWHRLGGLWLIKRKESIKPIRSVKTWSLT